MLPTADMAQFKQGVKSVAGKMAVLANGVMNSLQVRLGLFGLGQEGKAGESSPWRLAFTTSRHCCWLAAEPERERFLFLEGQRLSFESGPGAGPLPERMPRLC